MANVDVYVGNNVAIDQEVYQLWVNGYTANEAAQIQQKRGVLQQYNATFDMLLSDTQDHYRTYWMLEDLLKNPTKMTAQIEFQIPPEMQKLLIEKYYEFDQSVMREMLGKKLSARFRSSLDDTSDKTKVPLRSCRRQFDNVKQVFRIVEEMMGSLVENIKQNFLLPTPLAQQYAAIVFIANHRFETGKKKLQYLTFQDFILCANEMIVNWSYSSEECKDHEDMDVDMDRDFLLGLREVKVLGDREYVEEHRSLVQKSLFQHQVSPRAKTDIENNFKNISKTIINIAYNLNHSKELRDLFLDLVEKLIEPCKQANWSLTDIRSFLSIYTSTHKHIELFRQNPHLMKCWDRYMMTVQSCILQMYHS